MPLYAVAVIIVTGEQLHTNPEQCQPAHDLEPGQLQQGHGKYRENDPQYDCRATAPEDGLLLLARLE